MAREYTNVPMSLAYAPIGLPDPRPQSSSTSQHNPPSHQYNQVAAIKGPNSGNPSLNNNAQHPYPNPSGRPARQGSRSEEESDHEYYNELDKLKREMQPLQSARKNETTV